MHADRPALLPRCPTPHSSPPNQCLPTDTCRPFVTFLKASIQLQKAAPPKRGTAAPKRAAPSRLCSAGKDPPGHEDSPCSGGGNTSGSKTYLSTQRCPRVEVVGYPQHPQNGKTQEYPGFPPHGCRLRFRSAVGLFGGSAVSLFDTAGSIRAESRRTESAGFVSRSGERREGAGSSQPTSARLEGKG